MNKKPTKDQERRLRELDAKQQTLQSNLEASQERVREEASKYRGEQMTVITHTVMPHKEAYEQTRKQAERDRDKAIKAAHNAYSEAIEKARAVKREALETIEEEIKNLEKEVQRRIAAGDAELSKEFNEQLRGIVAERQAIRGVDKPKTEAVPEAPPAAAEEPVPAS